MDISDANVAAMMRDPLAFSDSDISALTKGDESDVLDVSELEEGEEQAPPATDATEGKPQGTTDKPAADAAPDTAAPKDADPAKKDEAAAASADTATAGTQPEEPPAGVLTKDGKRVIPYHVLEAERRRSTELEKVAREQASKIANLQQQAATGQPDLTPEVEDIDPETMTELEETAPTLAKLFKGQQATIKRLSAQVQGVQATQASNTVNSVQEAIDSIPKLAHVQAADVDAFNVIAALDIQLREGGKFADLTLPQRFEKAVAMYEAAHGSIQLPGAPGGKGAEPNAGDKPKAEDAPKDPQPSAAEIAAKAAKALADANAAARPDTLSDMPGGASPAKSEADQLSDTSAASLTARFMTMTPKQIDDYLGRLT